MKPFLNLQTQTNIYTLWFLWCKRSSTKTWPWWQSPNLHLEYHFSLVINWINSREKLKEPHSKSWDYGGAANKFSLLFCITKKPFRSCAVAAFSCVDFKKCLNCQVSGFTSRMCPDMWFSTLSRTTGALVFMGALQGNRAVQCQGRQIIPSPATVDYLEKHFTS